MIGGTLMQTIILVIVTFRTDWDKEVYKKKTFSMLLCEVLGIDLGML